jgi:hypothetical protein
MHFSYQISSVFYKGWFYKFLFNRLLRLSIWIINHLRLIEPCFIHDLSIVNKRLVGISNEVTCHFYCHR